MRILLLIFFSLTICFVFGQHAKDFLLVAEDTTHKNKFGLAFFNQTGDTVTRFDTTKYYICFSDTIKYFAIFGLRNEPGWWAVDRNGKKLFEVYNTSTGEPSPDQLTEDMIRIVDKTGKIGFANNQGIVIIRPQFEAATKFKKGKAIIGRKCKHILWCCNGKGTDKHYITQCDKTGYINNKGQIFLVGNLTIDQMKKKLGWSADE